MRLTKIVWIVGAILLGYYIGRANEVQTQQLFYVWMPGNIAANLSSGRPVMVRARVSVDALKVLGATVWTEQEWNAISAEFKARFPPMTEQELLMPAAPTGLRVVP